MHGRFDPSFERSTADVSGNYAKRPHDLRDPSPRIAGYR